MVTDVHCHYIPEAYLRYLDRHATDLGMRWRWLDDAAERAELRAGATCFAMSRDFLDADRHLARMDRLGIERSVLSLATPMIDYDAPAAAAVEGARLVNDELARLKAARPGRFDAWAYLPMQSPDDAAKELTRAVTELGLRGGHVSSNVRGRYLDAPEVQVVLDTAARLGVPLFVHPSNPPGRDRLGRYELAVVSGYLFDTTLNIFHMIFGGVLDRYPGLRVCCTHAGGYALTLRGRMQREIDTNPELATRLSGPLAAYLRRLYYDSVCLEPEYLAYAAAIAGSDRFVLGSDAPFPLGEPDPVAFVRRALAPGAAEQVLSLNAAGLFAA
jgi:aminocarboxymuconate-semialdehyde decarboxylase